MSSSAGTQVSYRAILSIQAAVGGAATGAVRETVSTMGLLFVFDMDDVLYDYDWRIRMAGLTELTGHDFAELRRRWWNATGEWAAEAGHRPDCERVPRGVVGARLDLAVELGSPTAAAA